MMTNAPLLTWDGVRRPERSVIEGRYCKLEPLSLSHLDSLFAAVTGPGQAERFRYLFDAPISDRTALQAWIERAAASADPLFFAVLDRVTGRAEGRQALMRIDTANGVIEIGNIFWGPAIARSRIATEALFLFADYVFALGYRRLEWKCDELNTPSQRAANRFGFRHEGVFRQHMVVKGRNRDTAWFAMLDADWPRLRAAYLAWLAPDNFDAAGGERTKLML